jgi:hypothetical protein
MIRVGVSSDPEILSAYGIDKPPTILFVNHTHQMPYLGRNSFGTMRSAVRSFLEGDYVEPFQFHVDFFLPEEYAEEVKDFWGYIVFQTTRKLDPLVAKAQRHHRASRIKFFYGATNLPLSFMKPDNLYIIAPEKSSAVKVDGPADLLTAIKDALDGKTKWIPFDRLA